ncbi:MAG: hypothetical protein V7785_18600 [Bermanella sp.]
MKVLHATAWMQKVEQRREQLPRANIFPPQGEKSSFGVSSL